eukprot:jgi/Psemu1/312053/fgenesh1_kg.872_\
MISRYPSVTSTLHSIFRRVFTRRIRICNKTTALTALELRKRPDGFEALHPDRDTAKDGDNRQPTQTECTHYKRMEPLRNNDKHPERDPAPNGLEMMSTKRRF